MAAFSNKKQIQMKAESLAKKTKFNKHEIEALLTMFRELTKHTGKLDRTMFRDILHKQFKMTDDIIMDRVFRVFDQDNDTCVNADEWVKGLSTFLRGSMEDKMKFCFAVFDMNGDGFVSREDIFQFLKHCIVKQTLDEDAEEGVKDMVDIMVKKMDHDHDARLSFDDFKCSVEADNLLLEAFGPCLPEEQSLHEVEYALKDPRLLDEIVQRCFCYYWRNWGLKQQK